MIQPVSPGGKSLDLSDRVQGGGGGSQITLSQIDFLNEMMQRLQKGAEVRRDQAKKRRVEYEANKLAEAAIRKQREAEVQAGIERKATERAAKKAAEKESSREGGIDAGGIDPALPGDASNVSNGPTPNVSKVAPEEFEGSHQSQDRPVRGETQWEEADDDSEEVV